MKKLMFLFLLLTTGLLSFTISCGSKNDPAGPSGGGGPSNPTATKTPTPSPTPSVSPTPTPHMIYNNFYVVQGDPTRACGIWWSTDYGLPGDYTTTYLPVTLCCYSNMSWQTIGCSAQYVDTNPGPLTITVDVNSAPATVTSSSTGYEDAEVALTWY